MRDLTCWGAGIHSGLSPQCPSTLGNSHTPTVCSSPLSLFVYVYLVWLLLGVSSGTYLSRLDLAHPSSPEDGEASGPFVRGRTPPAQAIRCSA